MEKTFLNRIEERKKHTNILILGPYKKHESIQLNGETCVEQLEKIKKSLQRNGFFKTRLVKDWLDEENIPKKLWDKHFLKKSIHYINEWAEVLLFVFLKEGDHKGVVREWSHMVEITDKQKNSVIIRHETIDLGSLIRGDIAEHTIYEYSFNNEDELHTRSFAGAFNVLYNLL
jgi:hypothetical protein